VTGNIGARLVSLVGLLAVTGYASEERPWTRSRWTLAGHFLAMLLVSEHGTGFGLLPLMLVLMGLPAFGALTLAGHIGRARCGVGSTCGRLSGAKRWRCKAPQPSLAGNARARCIRNTPSRVDAKKRGPSCVLSCASYSPCCCRLPHWPPRAVELSACRVRRPPLRGVTSRLRLRSQPRLTARPVWADVLPAGIRKDSAPVPAGQAFATRPARRLTAWQEGSGETTHSLLVPATACARFAGFGKRNRLWLHGGEYAGM